MISILVFLVYSFEKVFFFFFFFLGGGGGGGVGGFLKLAVTNDLNDTIRFITSESKIIKY
jgi:hypothetical protein